MTEKIRVGVIGCGVVSRSHIESYEANDWADLVAICDIRPDRIEETRTRYPDLKAKDYASVELLLQQSDVQAVSVCTDHASHEIIVRACLEAGKHVLCEKALTTSPESLERMLAAAGASDKVAAAVFQHRFDPSYRACRKIIQENLLGNLLTISAQHQCFRPDTYYTQDAWRGTWEGEGGSLLINQSIHFLDILQWIAGGVESVSAHMANRGHEGLIETEDTLCASFQFSSGALGTLTATSASNREWVSFFHITGRDGDIRLEDGKLISCSHRNPETATLLENRLNGLLESAGVDGAKDYYGTSHPSQIADFIDAIQEHRAPFVGFKDAGKTVSLVFACYESAKTGQRVSLV